LKFKVMHASHPLVTNGANRPFIHMPQSNYAKAMEDYNAAHPKPLRRGAGARESSELRRPQSAYSFFLTDFRRQYRVRLGTSKFEVPPRRPTGLHSRGATAKAVPL